MPALNARSVIDVVCYAEFSQTYPHIEGGHLQLQPKRLYTPGPLTTSTTVKAEQQRDLGSRDATFIETVADIRRRIVGLATSTAQAPYTAVLMQGSGTFGVESVISSVPAPQDHLLIVVNGAYGRRIVQMAQVYGISHQVLTYPEDTQPFVNDINATLGNNPAITAVVVVHCETTTGILNPLAQIAEVVNAHRRTLIVDAMSSFGGVPINVAELNITYLISSSNKCIQGVPGFSFVVANVDALRSTAGNARTLSLDLYAQWQTLEKTGQFRYTPPVQSMLAFSTALQELEAEGGVPGRAQRYQQNHATLNNALAAIGLRPYLPPSVQSHIITTYHYPDDPNFDFEGFYSRLSDRGFVIYPGKLTDADCFRIGNIGHLFPQDMTDLANAIREALGDMNVTLPGTVTTPEAN